MVSVRFFPSGRRRAEVTEDVFHHDHRAVDDHAEIERSQRKQVRRDVTKIEKNRGEQQREGNRQRHDEGAAEVAEEQEENHHHERDTHTRLCKTVRVVL